MKATSKHRIAAVCVGANKTKKGFLGIRHHDFALTAFTLNNVTL